MKSTKLLSLWMGIAMMALMGADNCSPNGSSETLRAGTWGGEHWEMTVNRDGTAFIEGDCSHGDVTEPIYSIDNHVSFSFEMIMEMGPQQENQDPATYEASFSGTLHGQTLRGQLTVERESSDFVVEWGEAGMLFKCL